MGVMISFYKKNDKKTIENKNLLIELDFMDKFNIVEKRLNYVNKRVNNSFTNQLVEILKFYREILIMDNTLPQELQENSELKLVEYKQIFKVHIEFFDQLILVLNSKQYRNLMSNFDLASKVIVQFRRLNKNISNNLKVDLFKINSEIFELTKELLEEQKSSLASIYRKSKVSINDDLKKEMSKYINLGEDVNYKLEFSKSLFDFSNSLNDILNLPKPEITTEFTVELESFLDLWENYNSDTKKQTDMLEDMVISQLQRTKNYLQQMEKHQEKLETEIYEYNYLLADLNNTKYSLNEYNEILQAFQIDLNGYSTIKVVYTLTIYNLFTKLENHSQKLRNLYKVLFVTENKNDVCDVDMENKFLILDEKLITFKDSIKSQIKNTENITMNTYDYRARINLILMFTAMIDLLKLNPTDLEHMSEIKPNLKSNIDFISTIYSDYYSLILDSKINNGKFKFKELLALSSYEELTTILESNNEFSNYITNDLFISSFKTLNSISDYAYHFDIQIKQTIYNFNKLFTNVILLELNVLKVTLIDDSLATKKFNIFEVITAFKKVNNQILFIKNNLNNTNGSVFYSFDKLLGLLLSNDSTQYKINNIVVDRILDTFNHFTEQNTK